MFHFCLLGSYLIMIMFNKIIIMLLKLFYVTILPFNLTSHLVMISGCIQPLWSCVLPLCGLSLVCMFPFLELSSLDF